MARHRGDQLLLRKKTDANEAAAPRELEGIPLELKEVGVLFPL